MADMVVIKNKLGQVVDVPVLDEEGTKMSNVRLAPRGVSAPMAKTRLTKFARGMRDRGFLRIRASK